MQTLTKLSKLYLIENKSLEELPQSITELHNLTELDLCACDLRSLPDKYVDIIHYILLCMLIYYYYYYKLHFTSVADYVDIIH